MSESRVALSARTSEALGRGSIAVRHVGQSAPLCVECVVATLPRVHPSTQYSGSAQAIVKIRKARSVAT